MRITLALDMDLENLTDFEGEEPTEEELKEELKQCLFEICEDWVLRGNEPDFEFSE